MPLHAIDLNSDVGESFGNYKLGLDEEVIPLISSANIACGYHAGDPAVMRQTVALALNHGVGLGAHPGLPDLVGFGRRNMDVTLEEIKDFVTYQIGALQAVAALQGARLQHVKPHGALYNMAVKNPAIWDAVAEVMAGIDERLILFVLAGSDRANPVGQIFSLAMLLRESFGLFDAGQKTGQRLADLAASFQAAVVEVLTLL